MRLVLVAAALTLVARPRPTRAASGSATLRWTAPGDDGLAGRATLYDLRYSAAPISDANFAAATHVSGVPAPATAGSNETFVVNGLITGQNYYFALKTSDEVANWSILSNVAASMAGSGTTATAPGAPGVALSHAWPDPARESASWTFLLPLAVHAEFEVFDLHGRHVRTFLRGTQAPGESEARWDLREDSGRRVPAGVYLLRASLGGDVQLRRVVVLR